MTTIVERNGRKELVPTWLHATPQSPSIALTSPRNVRRCNGPKIGFLSAAFMSIGGTETFHRMLLPRLSHVRNIAGFVATGFTGGDGSKLCVPFGTGIRAAKQLASDCDIIVNWGINCLSELLPTSRPKVVAVHHADWSSGWSNDLILKQRDSIDDVVCVNPDVAARLQRCGVPAHYIPNAIDSMRIIPTGRQHGLFEEFNIPPASKIVLFGHRLSAEKRPLLAVAVAKYLPRDWVMIIAGDGSERLTVESMAAGCERIRVVGEFDTLADWLAISDCFLSLSQFEGFGLAIGEAMLAGVPTVSTPTGIAPGLAITFPINSTAETWANAIVNSFEWKQPVGMLERFSVDKMVSAWADVLTL